MECKFWDAVTALLQVRNITYNDLADGTGIKYNTFTGWRANNRLPRIDDAIKISDFLGTSVEYLYRTIEKGPDKFITEKEIQDVEILIKSYKITKHN